MMPWNVADDDVGEMLLWNDADHDVIGTFLFWIDADHDVIGRMLLWNDAAGKLSEHSLPCSSWKIIMKWLQLKKSKQYAVEVWISAFTNKMFK